VRLKSLFVIGVAVACFVGNTTTNGAAPPDASVTATAFGFVQGNPEKAEPAYTVVTPQGNNNEWQVVITFGKWEPVVGGANRWVEDPNVPAIAPTPIAAAGGNYTTAPGGGINLNGGVAAGRITHICITLQKKVGMNWVTQGVPSFKEK
jgi:hypothetical protein